MRTLKETLLVVLLAFVISFSFTFAADANTNDGQSTEIPSVTIDQLMILSKSKQAKVDIIKKNNTQIENYKTLLSNQIIKAADEINNLKLEVSADSASISDEKLVELKSLLEFLQDSTKTLNEDATNVSNEIDAILDLIIAKGMRLEQYDQIIEKQNELIVKMKNILATVEKI